MFSPLASIGQFNLIPDPSFEDTIRCPGDSTITKARIWYNPTICGSPDYFYPTMLGNAICPWQYPGNWGGGGYSAATNPWGQQIPNSGFGYAGIACAISEFIATPLNDTLVAGKSYAVSFYASLSERYPLALDLLSFCFTSDSLTDYNTVTCWNYINTLHVDAGNQAGNFLTDTAGWTLVRDTFIAVGGERHLVFGNIDTAQTQYYVIDSAAPLGTIYYLDDFDVHCIDCIADTFEPPAYPEIVVTPSISSGEIILSGNLPEGTKFEVYDLLGQLVYYNELQNGNQTQQIFLQLTVGVYSYRVVSNNNVLKADKLVLVR